MLDAKGIYELVARAVLPMKVFGIYFVYDFPILDTANLSVFVKTYIEDFNVYKRDFISKYHHLVSFPLPSVSRFSISLLRLSFSHL